MTPSHKKRYDSQTFNISMFQCLKQKKKKKTSKQRRYDYNDWLITTISQSMTARKGLLNQGAKEEIKKQEVGSQ